MLPGTQVLLIIFTWRFDLDLVYNGRQKARNHGATLTFRLAWESPMNPESPSQLRVFTDKEDPVYVYVYVV
jgi:hypothetical protein